MTPELVAKVLATGAVTLLGGFFVLLAIAVRQDSDGAFQAALTLGVISILLCIAIVIPTIWTGGSLCP